MPARIHYEHLSRLEPREWERLSRHVPQLDIIHLFDLSGRDKQAEFIAAAERGDYNIVSALLTDFDIQPDFDNNLALRVATLHGRDRIITLLLNDPRVSIGD